MVGSLFGQKNSEKAKLPKICLSFGGSMPIAQIKMCHLFPPPPPYLGAEIWPNEDICKTNFVWKEFFPSKFLLEIINVNIQLSIIKVGHPVIL